MGNEIVLSQQNALVLMPAMDIEMALARRNEMTKFVKAIMVEDTDFGKIPGTGDKPTLLKPGAEKLTTFFGLTKRFEIVEKVEDWTGKDYNGEPFFYYLYRCQLYRSDMLIAESDGSCNSFEIKYRWRWVDESNLPAGVDKSKLVSRNSTISELDFAISKGETSGRYGKPVSYWQMWRDAITDGKAKRITRKSSGGKEMQAWEMGGTQYRVPNDDIASQVNTIQKMAQKRALIAATLLAVNASEFFTQDIEDMVDNAPSFRMSPVEPQADVVDGEFRTVTDVTPMNGNGHNNGNGNSSGFPWSDDPANVIRNGFTFDSPAQARAWAKLMDVFNSDEHCANAYDALKRDKKPANASEMWQAWINDIARRVNEKKEKQAEDEPFADAVPA